MYEEANSTERRKRILEYIHTDGKVKVDTLLSQFNVSVETIRRDLRILDEQGFVKRVYGGAIKYEKSIRGLPLSERLIQHIAEKEAIGQKAIDLLEEGDCIFIDGKTTCMAFVKAMPKQLKLTVVTNSIIVAHHLLEKDGHQDVFVVGGKLNEDGLTSGPKLYQELMGYRFDKAFFSAIAVDPRGCFYATTEPQQLAHTLREVSSRLILLADSSKFNRSAFLFGLDLDDFDYLVTDERVPESFMQSVKGRDFELIIASNT